MSIPKFVTFSKRVSDLSDQPIMDSATFKGWFDSSPEELRIFVNSLIDQIETNYALKQDLNGIVLGQISDGTVTDVKLSNAPTEIKQSVATHLADNTSHINSDERAMWNAGSQLYLYKNAKGAL